MAKVGPGCKAKLSSSQKQNNAWYLNWILGREFYRAKNDAFSLAYWDGLAWANKPKTNFTDSNQDRIDYVKRVGPGFEANTPGWDDQACTLDIPALACFAYWMASSSKAVQDTAVGLMQQYSADLPYLKTSCPSEVTEDPQYQIEVPPSPGTDTTTPGTTPGTTTPGLPDTTTPGTTTPGTLPDTTTPGSDITPVKADDTTTEKKINWKLYLGIGAAVLGGAALIGALRTPEYVMNPTGRILVKKIKLLFVEGPSHMHGKVVEIERKPGQDSAEVWRAASSVLKDWALYIPSSSGGYWKHDFVITWDDGETYKGRYDLESDDIINANLSKHVVRNMNFIAGLWKPAHMSQEQYEEYLKQVVSPKRVKEAEKFIGTHDLGPAQASRNPALSYAERQALPDSAFALPKSRDLPIHDYSHAKGAYARLNMMYRIKSVSRNEYVQAYRRIAKAAKKFGIEMKTPPLVPEAYGENPSSNPRASYATAEYPVNFSGKLYINRVPLDRGGYTRGGQYFGVGAPLFQYEGEGTENGDEIYLDGYIRAKDREAAKNKLRQIYKGVKFHR